jgi:hypothetical protein
MPATIYLATIKAWDIAGAAEVTLYFSSAPWISGPSDSPANTYYEPRIKQPAWIKRTAFGSRRTTGKATVSFGELVLANVDGGLDYFAGYAFDGRDITLTVGTLNAPGAPTWTTILVGKIEQAHLAWREVSIQIRDRSLDMDVPLQATKYAGTNALPAGLEGTADDLKGTPKPLLYGNCKNFTPAFVNTSRLIFQAHDGEIGYMDEVFDGGVQLSQQTVYASQAEMESTAPSAGYYRAWKPGGYFRLGSAIANGITASAQMPAAPTTPWSAADVMSDIADKAGIASGDIDADDVTAMNVDVTANINMYVGEEMTCSEAMDAVANSVGAYWGFDRLGKLRMRRLEEPAAPSAVTLTASDIIDIERVTARTEDKGLPAWSVTVEGYRNWTVQRSGLASGVSATRVAWLAKEYRSYTASDAAIKTAHPYAQIMTKQTLLDAAGAAAEATRLLALYGTQRDVYEVTAHIGDSALYEIDLCDTVCLQLPRFGMDGGRYFQVIGITLDVRTERVELTLWG